MGGDKILKEMRHIKTTMKETVFERVVHGKIVLKHVFERVVHGENSTKTRF